MLNAVLARKPRIAWAMPSQANARAAVNSARYSLEEQAADATARQAGAREVATSARSRGDYQIEIDSTAKANSWGSLAQRSQAAKTELPDVLPTALLCFALTIRIKERLARRAFSALMMRRLRRQRQRALVVGLLKRNLALVRNRFLRRWLTLYDRNTSRRQARKKEMQERETYVRDLEQRVHEASRVVAARKRAVEMHAAAFDAVIDNGAANPVNESDAAYRDALVSSFVEKERELERELMVAQNDLNDAVAEYFKAGGAQGGGSSRHGGGGGGHQHSMLTSTPAASLTPRGGGGNAPIGGGRSASSSYYSGDVVGGGTGTRRNGGVVSVASEPAAPLHAPGSVASRSPAYASTSTHHSATSVTLGGGPQSSARMVAAPGAGITPRELELTTQLNLATRALDEASVDARRYRDLVVMQQLSQPTRSPYPSHTSAPHYGGGQPLPPPSSPMTPPPQEVAHWPTPDSVAYSRHKTLAAAYSPQPGGQPPPPSPRGFPRNGPGISSPYRAVPPTSSASYYRPGAESLHIVEMH